MKNKIPKILHYVWVGDQPLNELALECIKSWQQHCLDFEMKAWSEHNIPAHIQDMIKPALENKNWAFASDIIRVWALYEFGGVYVDTDLKLINPIDDLLTHEAFFGYESNDWLGTAVLAAIPQHPILSLILKRYVNIKKINFNTNALTVHAFSAAIKLLYKKKLNGKHQTFDNICLLAPAVFYPMDYMTHKLYITKDTKGIHYYASSWHNSKQKRGAKFAQTMRKILGKHIFGLFEHIVAGHFYRILKKELKPLITKE